MSQTAQEAEVEREGQQQDELKLHIGGEQSKQGWKILNAQPKPGVPVDFFGNICDLSQFADASVTSVYASHVLEHVPQALVPPTLAGIHRILKVGGTFMVSVPNLEELCRLFLHPDGTADTRMHVMRMMFGGQTDNYDFHYFGWTWEFMQQCPTLLPPPLHPTSKTVQLDCPPTLPQLSRVNHAVCTGT
jgi:predicted SAM-dependent methyltransferase